MGKSNVKQPKRKKLPLTKEQKGARAILGVGIVLLIVLFIALIFALGLILNNSGVEALEKQVENWKKVEYGSDRLTPQKDADGYWCFTTDREFRVMQLTDVHIGGGLLSVKKDTWAINAVASMVTEEKPDLIVVTGDIAFPVPYASGSFNNLNATRIFAKLMENLGVYWTFAFGNHDTEAYSYYTREEINDYYENAIKNKELTTCLYQRGPKDIAGCGNSIIKVKNSKGIVTQALVTLDSHSYTNGDALGVLWKYDNIHQDQVDWFVKGMKKIDAENKNIDATAKDVKSLAFFHIPLVEYRDAYKEYYENGQKDTEHVKYEYGSMGETMKKNSEGVETFGVFCGMAQDNFFEQGAENGLQGVFCGHDHYNNFSLFYTKNGQTVRLTYGKSIDYLAYPSIWKERSQRGCTMITVDTDGSFDCEAMSYYQEKYKFKDNTKTE